MAFPTDIVTAILDRLEREGFVRGQYAYPPTIYIQCCMSKCYDTHTTQTDYLQPTAISCVDITSSL